MVHMVGWKCTHKDELFFRMPVLVLPSRHGLLRSVIRITLKMSRHRTGQLSTSTQRKELLSGIRATCPHDCKEQEACVDYVYVYVSVSVIMYVYVYVYCG